MDDLGVPLFLETPMSILNVYALSKHLTTHVCVLRPVSKWKSFAGTLFSHMVVDFLDQIWPIG